MKPSLQGLILLTILILCIPVVSATTCTVLNVTTGPAGPAGAAGANGTSCTTSVNYTFTLAAGSPATVVNVGNGTVALLDFGIPTGATGAAGAANMTAGPAGAAATINVNYTFTGAPGTSALVSNIGTPAAASFDFTIPTGANGTAGTPGVNGTSATIAVNYTFTGTAGTAANVTNVGNTTVALFDFTIPEGMMNQTANMTAGAAGAPGGTGGQLLFFNHSASADIAGYESLGLVPAGNAEADESVTVKANRVIIDSYATKIGYPGLAGLPAGLWQFRSYNYVSNAGGISSVLFSVYNRTAGGTETLLFNATSEEIDATVVTAYVTTYVQTAAYTTSITDRIVIKVYAQTDSATNKDVHFVYDGSAHTSNAQTPLLLGEPSTLTYTARAGQTLKKGQALYISGASGNDPVVSLADNTNSTKCRVVGLSAADVASNGLDYVRRAGILTAVDTQATNLNINPNAETWLAGDLLWVTTGGGLTKVRPTSGRSVKAAYSMLGSNANDVLLVYAFENPVWSAAAAGEDVVLRLGDSAGVNKVSIRNYTNTEVAWIRSNGTSSFTTNAANLTQYAYVTLMAGSGMIPTTNPPSAFNQWETGTNKNNYIYANFTAGSSNNTQWIVDMPSDWNGGNIVGSFLWTAASGTGTVNWTLSGYRFADNVDIDTALPLIGNATDTVQTVGYMHISPDTGSAAVTGTGNTIIFKVGRSTDTLTYAAQLIGVRIKYIKVIGAV